MFNYSLRCMIQVLGIVLGIVIITVCLFPDMIYIYADSGYRSGLRAVWTARYGEPVYTQVFTEDLMKELKNKARAKVLKNANVDRNSPFKVVEDHLERSLGGMYQRREQLSALELQTLGKNAWNQASVKLKALSSNFKNSPIANGRAEVMVYNRIPKSGSTFLLEMLMGLRVQLGYLVTRGGGRTYRYYGKEDRDGLGYFLEEATSHAKTVFVQHQYFINFTQPPHRVQQPLYVNMMRDPVEHLISNYFFQRLQIIQRRNRKPFTEEEIEVMVQPFEQCVVERRLECVYSGYSVYTNKSQQLGFYHSQSPVYLRSLPSDVMLYFCGHDPECLELGNPRALQKAKENVDRHFVVVGVLELLDQSLAVMENKLPSFFKGIVELNRKKQGKVKNKNTVKARRVSDEVMEAMRERLAPEYELYNHVKHKLLKQYQEIPRNSRS